MANKNFAFIDSQNLNLGIKSQGWDLDFRKFREYLANKYGVKTAYLFIGNVPGNESLYDYLQECGYRLILKPTVEFTENGLRRYKGNVDAELVLYSAAKVFNEYDKAVIVSGDGDFRCLLEYLSDKKKLERLLVPSARYSKLLKEFNSYIVRIDHSRYSLESKYKNYNKKTRTSGRLSALGIPGNGDEKIIANKPKKVNGGKNR
jgi:uncharacterized LabA/DUF88 family protein